MQDMQLGCSIIIIIICAIVFDSESGIVTICV